MTMLGQNDSPKSLTQAKHRPIPIMAAFPGSSSVLSAVQECSLSALLNMGPYGLFIISILFEEDLFNTASWYIKSNWVSGIGQTPNSGLFCPVRGCKHP